MRVIEDARRAAARSVNAVMTATYWFVGRRIVEPEQRGQARAAYGEALLERLSNDLTARFRRGFSVDNLETMRLFSLAYPPAISETASRKSSGERSSEALSRKFDLTALADRFREFYVQRFAPRADGGLGPPRGRAPQPARADVARHRWVSRLDGDQLQVHADVLDILRVGQDFRRTWADNGGPLREIGGLST